MTFYIFLLILALFIAWVSSPWRITTFVGDGFGIKREPYDFGAFWKRFVVSSIILCGLNALIGYSESREEKEKPVIEQEIENKWEVFDVVDVFGDDTGKDCSQYRYVKIYEDKIIIDCEYLSIVEQEKVIKVKNQAGEVYELGRGCFYDERATILPLDDNYHKFIEDLKQPGIVKIAYPSCIYKTWTSYEIPTLKGGK